MTEPLYTIDAGGPVRSLAALALPDPALPSLVLPDLVLPGLATAVYSGPDGGPHQFDLATGELIDRIPAIPGIGPLAIVATEEGTVVAGGGPQGAVWFWDSATGEVLNGTTPQPLETTIAVSRVSRADDTDLVVSVDEGGHGFTLWNPVTGEPVGQRPMTGARVVGVTAAPLRNGTTCIATRLSAGMVTLHLLHTGGPSPVVDTSARAMAFAATRGGTVLLGTGAADGILELWDAITGDSFGNPIAAHDDVVSCMTAVPADGRRELLATGSEDGTVRLWDPDNVHWLGPRLELDGPVTALAAVRLPDGRVLLATGDQKSVKTWDLTDVVSSRVRTVGEHSTAPATSEPGPSETMATADDERPAVDPLRHEGAIRAVATTAYAGQYLIATAGDDGTIRVRDRDTREPYGAPIVTGQGAIHAIVLGGLDLFSLTVTSAGADGTIRRWSCLTGNEAGPTIAGHDGDVRTLLRLAGGTGPSTIVSGGRDGQVRFWNASTGEPVGESLARHTGGVRSVVQLDLPQYRRLLAVGGDDGMVRLWDPVAREPVGAPLVGHGGAVVAMAAVPLPSGRTLLATGSTDGTVRIWDPETGVETTGARIRIGRPIRTVDAMPFEDGEIVLVVAPEKGAVELWDPMSRTVALGSLGFSAQRVSAVTTTSLADGRVLVVAGDEDGVVHRWPLRTGFDVRTRGFADRRAPKDLLGRSTIVSALSDVVGPSSNVDGGPTVVAVEGPWGAGKSTVLGLLKDKLCPPVEPVATKARRLTVGAALWRLVRPPRASDQEKHQGERRIVGAWFNPWAHQSADQVWAGLAHEILDAVGPSVHGTGNSAERYWFTKNLPRLDQRQVYRQLWRRALSPLLAVAVFALVLPLATQLATKTSRVELFGERVPSGLLAASIPTALLLAGLLHTAGRLLFARAAGFLPGELFRGPVLSGAMAAPDPRADGIRDPLFRARSGYLYLVQHDVRDLLADLDDAGGELLLFIDDLDRCTPATTAQVLEAINLFLSESFPRARFVIGLDPVVVAAHIDRTYTDLLTTPAVSHTGDPSPGWTFLRKLVQLPVALPAVPDDGIERLLDDALGPARAPGRRLDPPRTSEEPPASEDSGERRDEIIGLDDVLRADSSDRPAEPAPSTPHGIPAAPPESAVEPDPSEPAITIEDSRLAQALERDHTVRQRLNERLAAQPDRSGREAKRLLTIWQFYLRVAQLADPLVDQPAAVRRACDLVLVAEILTRWPAQQRALRAVRDGRQALGRLAATASDDGRWAALVTESELDGPVATALRALLRDYDGNAVASLYARLT